MTPEAAQRALGVDAWGLNQLVAQGEFAEALDDRSVKRLAEQRDRVRAQALKDLARMDGPHLAPSGSDAPVIAAPDAVALPEDFDRPAVFLDACVLVSAVRRHLVLALAEAGFFYPRWSEKVLFETGHAHARIVDGKPDRDGPGEASQLVMALEHAWPEAMVPTEEADLIKVTGKLPDPDDAHVMQAAAAGQARVILTENMKDFPRATLKPLGLYARPSGEFIASRLGLAPAAATAAVLGAAHRLGLSAPRFGLALQRARLGSLAKKLGF
ncbi:conserved hypothetical protein [Oceanicaulis sp. 350]|nr:conserved hypothetical protein [Oceanicaulis sp. 350]